MVVSYRARKLTPEDEEQLKKDIDEAIYYLRKEKIEKGLEKAEQMFSREDGYEIAPQSLENFFDEMLYGEHLPTEGHKNKYIEFLKMAINRKIFKYKWMNTRRKYDIPSPIVNVVYWLISEAEYNLARKLMISFPKHCITGERFVEVLTVIIRYNELIQKLKRKIPDLADLEKCLKNPKEFDEVFLIVMGHFKETGKESIINKGKKEVRKKIQKCREEPKRYINKLEQKYPKTYEILYSVEAIFSDPMFRKAIWKNVEATPRAVNYFKSIETFLETRIPHPDTWNLGDYIHEKKGVKSVLNEAGKRCWRDSYGHKTSTSRRRKDYSLYDALTLFLGWRNGKLHTGITKWDFVDSQLSPFTYKLLCNLIDGVT